ncbi:glycosyltransferase family 2 protein [Hymenobacter lucidus]|uniref:Glycosyltransferase n=1 Tax=Hymenobacter lucidus TaxID=2880930 RepID=A0ABS8ARC1_9BACT|nr:glycosyltransferase [Hymenobacter lucidus]MCB2407271.1 glycosyltransferase [Hymenobacter lucidus]
MSSPSHPKVSVVMLAYNHQQFIRQALDSVLMQEVNFPYEIIIGEDCSTDQTRSIVQEYARLYPDIIRPIYHSPNGGMGRNLQACLAAVRGEYLAPLEGDDYWTDARKLQKQVDFLATHPEYSMCFHEVMVIDEEPYQVRGITSNEDEYTFETLLASKRTVPMTCSLLLRNRLAVLPEWLFAVPMMDYPLVILQAEHGKLKRLPDVMAAYRKHAGGSWSAVSHSQNHRRYIAMYQRLAAHYAPTSRGGIVRQALYRHCLYLADHLIKSGEEPTAPYFLQRALATGPGLSLANLKSLVGVTSRYLRASLAPRGSRPNQLDEA